LGSEDFYVSCRVTRCRSHNGPGLELHFGVLNSSRVAMVAAFVAGGKEWKKFRPSASLYGHLMPPVSSGVKRLDVSRWVRHQGCVKKQVDG
jgi:hypothetical protein